MHPSQLPKTVTGFADYFKLNIETDQLIEELGFRYRFTELVLPHTAAMPDWVSGVATHISEILSLAQLTGETSRRELMIAPVITRIARHLRARLRIEYTIYASEQLHGSLDYLLEKDQQLLVIEAKDTNITRGFRQLAAEMIALDQWTTMDTPLLYGAVTFGDGWQFGYLDRREKTIVQDTVLYTVPAQLETVVGALLAFLTGEGQPAVRELVW